MLKLDRISMCLVYNVQFKGQLVVLYQYSEDIFVEVRVGTNHSLHSSVRIAAQSNTEFDFGRPKDMSRFV